MLTKQNNKKAKQNKTSKTGKQSGKTGDVERAHVTGLKFGLTPHARTDAV